MNTVADLIRFAEATHGEKTAIDDVVTGRTATFAGLVGASRNLAAGLAELGVTKGERGVLLMSNHIEFVEADLAFALAGVVKAALPLGSAPETLASQLDFVEPAVIVVDADEFVRVRAELIKIPSLRYVVVVGDVSLQVAGSRPRVLGLSELKAGSAAPSPVLRADDPYGLRFTSGTTDRPKAVLHDHGGFAAVVTNQLLNVNWGNYLQPEDRFLQFLPLSAGTVFWLYSCLVSGVTTVLSSGFDPVDTLAAIRSTGTTCTFMVPPMISAVVAATGGVRQHTALKTVFMGGTPMPSTQLREAIDVFGDVFLHYYAASEYPVCSITMHRGEQASTGDAVRSPASCGRPALGTEIALVDEEDEPVAPGVIGNLLLGGGHVFREYWRNPQATQHAKTPDGWVRTGDMARQDADGYVYLVERKQDVIGTGEQQVIPGEVEDVIAGVDGVAEAVVVGLAIPGNAEMVKRPVAVVCAEPDSELTEDDVLAVARERLHPHEVPVAVHVWDKPLPKSALGKVLRRQVREIVEAATPGART